MKKRHKGGWWKPPPLLSPPPSIPPTGLAPLPAGLRMQGPLDHLTHTHTSASLCTKAWNCFQLGVKPVPADWGQTKRILRAQWRTFPRWVCTAGQLGTPPPHKKKKKRPAALWHKLSADPKQPHPLRLYFTPAVLTTMMKVVVPQSCPAHPQRATTRTTKPREKPWEEREQNQERTGEQGRGTHQSVSVVSSMTSW